MKIYVVRHCSTEFSEKKIHCGSTDIPLSPRGREEAARLAAAVRTLPFRRVISSPLLRARETAEAIADGRMPVEYDVRLAERRFGDFEGTSVGRPDGRRFRYSFACRYPNGESNLQVAARVYSLLGELEARGEDVLLVTHGSACRILRTYFIDMTDEEFYAFSQPNGTVEEYRSSN